MPVNSRYITPPEVRPQLILQFSLLIRRLKFASYVAQCVQVTDQFLQGVCVCVCVCARERERERERMCVCMCMRARAQIRSIYVYVD